ncbi:MAG: hypothetical protein ACTS27_05995 [Phycisphaerales bacterium]
MLAAVSIGVHAHAQTCVPEIATTLTPAGEVLGFGIDIAQGSGRLAVMDPSLVDPGSGLAAIRLYDVSDPYVPVLLADIFAARRDDFGLGIDPNVHIEIDGGTLWMYRGNTGDLVAIDISDPSQIPPSSQWPAYNIGAFGGGFSERDVFIAESGRLYRIKGDFLVRVDIYDASDPMQLAFTANFDGNIAAGTEQFLLDRERFFVSMSPANSSTRLDIWSLSNPASPHRVSSTSFPGYIGGLPLAANENALVLFVFNESQSEQFYLIIDVSDPAAPVLVGALPLTGAGTDVAASFDGDILRMFALRGPVDFAGCENSQYAEFDLSDLSQFIRRGQPVRFAFQATRFRTRSVNGGPQVLARDRIIGFGAFVRAFELLSPSCVPASLPYDVILTRSTELFDGAPELDGVPLADADILLLGANQPITEGFVTPGLCDGPPVLTFEMNATARSIVARDASVVLSGNSALSNFEAERTSLRVDGSLTAGVITLVDQSQFLLDGLLTVGDISLTDGSVLRHSDAAVTEIAQPKAQDRGDEP